MLYASLPELSEHSESLELLGPMWGSVGAMGGQRAGITDVTLSTLSASEVVSELGSGSVSVSVSGAFGVEASDVGGVSVGPRAKPCRWSMGPRSSTHDGKSSKSNVSKIGGPDASLQCL